MDLGFFATAENLDVEGDSHDTSEIGDRMDVDDDQLEASFIASSVHKRPPPPPPPAKERLEVHAPTLKEIEANHITKLAAQHWSFKARDLSSEDKETSEAVAAATPKSANKKAKSSTRKDKKHESASAVADTQDIAFNPKLVITIWNEELMQSEFSLKKVMLLEFSQYLEQVSKEFY